MGKASKKKARRRPGGDPRQAGIAQEADITFGYREQDQLRPPLASPERVRQAEAEIIRPGIPASRENAIGLTVHGMQQGLPDVAERLTEVAPGLAAKLGQGLSKDELQELGPEIARAMHAAGAGPGTYVFTDQGEVAEADPAQARVITGGSRDDGESSLPAGVQPGDIIAAEQPIGYVEAEIDLPEGAEIAPGARVWRAASGNDAMEALQHAGLDKDIRLKIRREVPQRPAGPEIVITDNLDDLETSDVDLVIEDLDPDNPDDAGRVLIGRPEQVRRYHERTRELDRRVMDLLGSNAAQGVLTEAAADLIPLKASWTADTVLGHHAWLTHHYRNPGAELADYLAFIMREQTGESFLSAGIFWPVDLSGGPADQPEGRQLAQVIARGLGEAETFQVTRAMCEDMRRAWEQSGLHADPLPLSEGELPVPAGFCWLDKPWMIREDEGHWIPVRAVSWERTIAMVSSERQGLDRVPVDSVRMAIWLAIDDTVAFGHWEDPARAAKTATWLGQVVLHRVVMLPFDFGREVNRGHTALIGMLGLLHTLWTYLGMELPRSRPVPASAPAVRRRAQKSLKHDAVHIITLRKYDYIGDRPAAFPKVVHWSCRWWVEKFFRHIDRYDDEDPDGRRRRHKPVPAARTGLVYDDDHDVCGVCLANDQVVRITEVHGFFKGPSDKPIRTPSRERTLSKLSR